MNVPYIIFDYIDGYATYQSFVEGINVSNRTNILSAINIDIIDMVIDYSINNNKRYFFVPVKYKKNFDDFGYSNTIFEYVYPVVTNIDFYTDITQIDKKMLLSFFNSNIEDYIFNFVNNHLKNYSLNIIKEKSKIDNKLKILVFFSPYRVSGALNNAIIQSDSVTSLFVRGGVEEQNNFGYIDLIELNSYLSLFKPDYILSMGENGFCNRPNHYNYELMKLISNYKIILYAGDPLDNLINEIIKFIPKENIYIFIHRTNDIEKFSNMAIKSYFVPLPIPNIVKSDSYQMVENPKHIITFIGNNPRIDELQPKLDDMRVAIGDDRYNTLIDKYLYQYNKETIDFLLELDKIYPTATAVFGEYQRTMIIYKLESIGMPLAIYGFNDRYPDLKSYKNIVENIHTSKEIYSQSLICLDFLRLININTTNDRVADIINSSSFPLMCGYSKLSSENIFDDDIFFYENIDELITIFDTFCNNIDKREFYIKKYFDKVSNYYSTENVFDIIVKNIT